MNRPAGPAPSVRVRPHGWIPRTLDVTIATVALVLLAPVLVVAAVAVRLTSPGQVLFRQQRLGAGGRPFECYKLRSMYAGADDQIHRQYVRRVLSHEALDTRDGVFKLVDDPRVTPVGRLLRRTSLDEVPQLLNVLKGEMALVGPRPMLPFEAELLEPWQHERFSVRPGLTGLWQVSGRSAIRADEAVLLDVEYARTRSVGLDLRLLARTPAAVLRLDRAA